MPACGYEFYRLVFNSILTSERNILYFSTEPQFISRLKSTNLSISANHLNQNRKKEATNFAHFSNKRYSGFRNHFVLALFNLVPRVSHLRPLEGGREERDPGNEAGLFYA